MRRLVLPRRLKMGKSSSLLFEMAKGVRLAATVDGLLAVISYQVALDEGSARRRLARKMLLPVFPHL
jgi:hypothetical protein